MTDEEFFAWLDGELDDAAAAEVAAAVAADPSLAERARLHRQMEDDFRAAFDPVMTAQPDRASAPIDFLAAKRRRVEHAAPRPITRRTQWAAMAATLAIGIVTGVMVGPGAPGPVTREDGRVVAAAALEEALYTRLASAPAGDGVRVGLTFRDRSGALCRSFAQEGLSGLACRDNGDWQLRGLFQKPGEGRGDYRMAAGDDPRLAAMIDDTIAGEPLDAAAEKAALENGWR